MPDGIGTPPLTTPGVEGRRGLVRAPRNLAAGSSLVAIALFTLWAGSDLESGRLGAMGPGMMPRGVAALVGLIGLGIVFASFVKQGEALERWSFRGPIFVTLGIVAFSMTIRLVGLAVAGPLVVMIGGAASAESRPRELAIFAVLVTALCVGLFRYALGLPMPILVIPGVVRI